MMKNLAGGAAERVGDVSEYALNARMRSVWKETKWDTICWKEEWINRKAFILCRVGHVLKIPKTPCYQKC